MEQILELIRSKLRFLEVLVGTRGAKKEAEPFESRQMIPGGLASSYHSRGVSWRTVKRF